MQKITFASSMKDHFIHNSSKLSVILSVACAIHCVAMPLLMLSFPFLHDSFLGNPMLEWGILLSLVVFGIISLDHYKKKHHGNSLPIILFGIGASICFLALISHNAAHHALMVIGSLIIAASQILNLGLKRVIFE